MKILYTTFNTFPSNSANSVHILNMAMELKKRSQSFVLFVPNRYKCTKLKSSGLEIDAIDSNIRYGAYTNPQKLGMLFFVFHLLFFSIQYKPDFIICRHIFSSVLLSFFNKKTFLELHVLPKGSNLLLLKYLKNRNLKLITISNVLKNDLKKIGLDSNVLHDCANIVDDSKIAEVELNGKQKISVGYVGSAFLGKGVEVIIELAKKCLDIDFYIIGVDFNDIPINVSNSFSGNVYFVGRVGNSLVPSYIKLFDICLLPNQKSVLIGRFFWDDDAHNDANSMDIGKYTSPLKLFEYMAQKKPIISSNIDSIKEVLLNNKNALIVESDNIASWEKALYELVNNESIRKELGLAAYNTFIDKYTWSKRVDSYINMV
ncbi:glycosyltransferase family 4 protein [Flavobacterium rakeshii]|uniref:glycosyltransferase family 4 protein n=1 Tax=Flavobacterium rakeshii TaxID=1038845 RepID=UPI002E7BF3D8|nr:glycosyltransferase family 4 protein [Flavobacterium rakeshii]MEE1896847.1 glycosyltransferase family 4 protein [Flavobacterium rakeshii]